MMNFARIILIDGRIWRREPCLKLLLQLVPCECLSALTANDGAVKETNIEACLFLFWDAIGGRIGMCTTRTETIAYVL